MFYSAFPFLLYYWATRMNWLNTRGRLITLFFALWAIGLLPHLFYTVLNPDHLAAPADRYTSTHLLRFLKYTPPPYICTFLCGVTSPSSTRSSPSPRDSALVIAAFALALLGLFFYTGAAAHVPYLFMHGGFLVPLFSLLTLGLAGPNPISWHLLRPPLVLLGEATFALYLLHFNVYILIHNYHLPERLHLAAYDPWVSYVLLLARLHRLPPRRNPARKAILRRFSHKPQPVANLISRPHHEPGR